MPSEAHKIARTLAALEAEIIPLIRLRGLILSREQTQTLGELVKQFRSLYRVYCEAPDRSQNVVALQGELLGRAQWKYNEMNKLWTNIKRRKRAS